MFDFFQLHLETIDDDENYDDNGNGDGDDDDNDDVQVHGLDPGQTRFVVNLE